MHSPAFNTVEMAWVAGVGIAGRGRVRAGFPPRRLLLRFLRGLRRRLLGYLRCGLRSCFRRRLRPRFRRGFRLRLALRRPFVFIFGVLGTALCSLAFGFITYIPSKWGFLGCSYAIRIAEGFLRSYNAKTNVELNEKLLFVWGVVEAGAWFYYYYN